MPGVDYVINGCSSLGTTLGASHWRKNIIAVITQDRVIDDGLRQIKNRTCLLCIL